MTRFLSGLLLCIWAAQAEAQSQIQGAVMPDPFYLNEAGIRDTGNRDVSALGFRTLSTNPAVPTLVMLCAGQSNFEAITAIAYTPANPLAIDNFNIYDSAIYNAVDPLVGSGARPLGSPIFGYHPCLVLADKLVTAGKFARVIIVPFALGGSSVADWTTGVLANRPVVAVKRLAQRGIAPGTNVTFVFLWGQGESDNFAGTSQANYTAGFNTLVANMVAAGFSGRVLIAKETYNFGVVSAAVQAAQTSNAPSGVINNSASPAPIYLGASVDTFVGSICNGGNACRQADNTHLTTDGVIQSVVDATNGWQKALANTGAPF